MKVTSVDVRHGRIHAHKLPIGGMGRDANNHTYLNCAGYLVDLHDSRVVYPINTNTGNPSFTLTPLPPGSVVILEAT